MSGAAADLAPVALRCRTSDTSPGGVRGVDTLAAVLAERLGSEVRAIGTPGEPREGRWDEDLDEARGCLLEAGGQVEDALRAGRRPLILAAECSIALATLPAVARERPDAKVLWLDAHGDFNSPETTQSSYLGGMALAGACGVWDAGFAPQVDPRAVVLAGVRDLDEPERRLLGDTEVRVLGASSATAHRARLALDGAPVYVHLDVDVLDPSAMAAVRFPTPGGLSAAALGDLFAVVAADCEVVGVEVTAFDAPEDPVEATGPAALIVELIEPLLAPSRG